MSYCSNRIMWYNRGRQAGTCGIYRKEHARENFWLWNIVYIS